MPGRSAAQTSVGDNGGGISGSRRALAGRLACGVDGGGSVGIKVTGGGNEAVWSLPEHAVAVSSRIAIRADRRLRMADLSTTADTAMR